MCRVEESSLLVANGQPYMAEKVEGMDMFAILLGLRADRAWLEVSDGRRNVLLHLPPNVAALSQLFV